LVRREMYQIDQPLVYDDFVNAVINVTGVVSLAELKIIPRMGSIDGRSYSLQNFKFKNATKDRMIFGPKGSIFEMKFPLFDIVGSAV